MLRLSFLGYSLRTLVNSCFSYLSKSLIGLAHHKQLLLSFYFDQILSENATPAQHVLFKQEVINLELSPVGFCFMFAFINFFVFVIYTNIFVVFTDKHAVLKLNEFILNAVCIILTAHRIVNTCIF